jgi:hypothetical protein
VKKKKPKERPQPSETSASGGKISAGSKRKLEQVDHGGELRIHDDEIHDDDSPIEKKRKRKNETNSDSINNVL